MLPATQYAQDNLTKYFNVIRKFQAHVKMEEHVLNKTEMSSGVFVQVAIQALLVKNKILVLQIHVRMVVFAILILISISTANVQLVSSELTAVYSTDVNQTHVKILVYAVQQRHHLNVHALQILLEKDVKFQTHVRPIHVSMEFVDMMQTTNPSVLAIQVGSANSAKT